MTTAEDVLGVARSYLGTSEQPMGSNNAPPFTTSYGMSGAWCAMFVSFCFYEAGLPLRASSERGFAWVSGGFDWMRAQGWNFTDPRDAAPGDLVAWNWDGGSYDHIGIVESVRPDGLVTIEGNVGDRVQRLFRSWDSGICELARPPFSGGAAPTSPVSAGAPALGVFGPGSSGEYVRTIQALVRVSVDGLYGPATEAGVKAHQTLLGITPDGVWGPVTQGATESFFQWLGTQSQAPSVNPEALAALADAASQVLRRGSAGGAVKVCQVSLGSKGFPVAVDGLYGPATEAAVRSFQAANALGVDGVVGPVTWSALFN